MLTNEEGDVVATVQWRYSLAIFVTPSSKSYFKAAVNSHLWSIWGISKGGGASKPIVNKIYKTSTCYEKENF